MTEDLAASQRPAAVVIMAAGAGTRMRSATAKVLHPLAGRSMIAWAVEAAAAVEPERLIVVVGHQREQVQAHVAEIAPQALFATQAEPRGTGDAVRSALSAVPDLSGEILVTSGDVPLLQGETLRRLLAAHREQGNAITVLTARVPDPTGYGRVVRTEGSVSRIVEQADANLDELAVDEINAGVYVFDAELLAAQIARLGTENAQGEFYLTDVVSAAVAEGRAVGAELLTDHLQIEGVNDRVQLAERSAELNRRILRSWMLRGVTVLDPATTWVEAGVDLAPDVTLARNTSLAGATSVAGGAVIGPDTTLVDAEVGENATVLRSHAELVVIEAGATIGPFSYLRPGTEVGPGAKVGAFVETKKAVIGAGAKVPHLTYCGDAVIGEGSNIGAGTIFANYDGVGKFTTTVGAHSFVGSDSVLVAPVSIGDGAYVAAGSALTEDVGPGELAVARGHQRNIPGWVAKRRPGSASDAAAQAAQGDQE